MIQLTTDLVLDFWSYTQVAYGSEVRQKDNAAVMQIAARLLDVLGIQDREQFLSRFTTTLGHTIYIPFTLGIESSRFTLWSQIVICVHEHQHIVQGDRDGWAAFDTRYLTSSSYRAGYEAEAYGANLEMVAWHYKRAGVSLTEGEIVTHGAQLAAGLKHYGCTTEDIRMAQQMLMTRAQVIALGGVETESAQRAIAWLEARMAA